MRQEEARRGGPRAAAPATHSASERLLRSVLQAVPDGVVVVDANGCREEWSAGADAKSCGCRGATCPWRTGWHTTVSTRRIARRRSCRSDVTRSERQEIFSPQRGLPERGVAPRDVAFARRRHDGRRVRLHDVTREKAGQEQLMILRTAWRRWACFGPASRTRSTTRSGPRPEPREHARSCARPPEACDERAERRDARRALGGRARERSCATLEAVPRHEDGAKDRADVKEAWSRACVHGLQRSATARVW